MQIKIERKDKTITYNLEKIKGRTYRNILSLKEELYEKLDKKEEFTLKDFDDMCNIIVEAYGNKFSFDELVDSIDSSDLMPYIAYILQQINNDSETKINKLVNSL